MNVSNLSDADLDKAFRQTWEGVNAMRRVASLKGSENEHVRARAAFGLEKLVGELRKIEAEMMHRKRAADPPL